MMLSQSSTDCIRDDVDKEGSQTWEEISLSDEEYKPSNNIPSERKSQSECTKNVPNLAKKTAQQFIDATPDFLVHISSIMMFCLLTYFILNKNGVASNDLKHFQHLSILWVTSITGGYLIRMIRLPPLLGMILASVIITNTTLKFQIPETWGETITSSGFSIILLLSGLELDLSSVQKSSGVALRLTFIPGIVEAISSGLFATFFFNMPFGLGLSLGFILGAVSPALVVVGMLKLQNQGFGIQKGIPSLVIAAASFDDIVAITGFSFFIGLAIQSEHKSVLYSVLHGPLSVIIGISLGLLGGLVLSITKLLNKSWKRSTFAFLIVLCIMFGMKQLSYAGAGAMGSLVSGIVASYNWQNGIPKELIKEASDVYIKEAQSHVSILWKLVFEPLLFGFIGASLDFDLLEGKSILKSVGVVGLGVSCRLVAAYYSTGGDTGLTEKERAFIALTWIPKATVQAALCSFPLMLAKDVMHTDHQDYDNYILWGNQIVSTAIFSILITAPLGLLFIEFLGPKWLTKDENIKPNDKTTTIDYQYDKAKQNSEKCSHISRIDTS